MSKQLVRKFWSSLPNPLRLWFIRTSQRKFTISVAAVVTNNKGEVLLLNHVLRSAATWGMPGGFIDHGEQPDDAVRREVMEEAGIELADLRMVRVRTIHRHVEILYSAKAIGTAAVNSREIIELGWFSRERMAEHVSCVQRTLIEDVLDRES